MRAIARDPVGASSTVSVVPEHFVSSTVVKVPRVGDLKAGSVRLTAVVTNVRSGTHQVLHHYPFTGTFAGTIRP